MRQRHTEGPWEAVTDRMYHDTPYLVVGSGASDVKSVEWMPLYVQVGGRTGWVEQKANTMLIAAAPELLSALIYDEPFRTQVITGQRARLKDFSRAHLEDQVRSVLAAVA